MKKKEREAKIKEIKDLVDKDPSLLDSLPLLYREAVKQIRDVDGGG